MTVPPANFDTMKMRLLLNSKNTDIRRDDHPSISGDVMANIGSPMQASDAGLLNKVSTGFVRVALDQHFYYNFWYADSLFPTCLCCVCT